MPIKLANVLGQTSDVQLDFEGEKLNVTFRPKQYTPKLVALASKQGENDGSLPAFLQLLVKVIVKWDLIGDDEKPIPITVEALGDVPYEILNAITNKINETLIPNPTPGNSSGSFS